MRIVAVATIPFGGPISHLRTLLPHVAASGVDVEVLCADDAVARSFRNLGIEARVVPMRHAVDLRGPLRAWGSLRGADIVHTHDRRAGLLARPAARLAGARSVHTLHGLPEDLAPLLQPADVEPAPRGVVTGTPPTRLAWQRIRAERWLAALGTTIVPSRALQRFLVDRGFDDRRLHVLPSAVDVHRTEAPAAHDPFIVGTAANLEHWKGVDVLVEACARVKPAVRLEVLGDGTERPRLERRATDLGLDARFHGRVADVGPHLEAMDAFAMPSRADNLPVGILEAMGAALPVVATRVGGIPELVTDHETGLLVPSDDPDAMAAAIGSLASDDEGRRELGRAGARRAAADFDPTDVAGRLVEIYERVLAA